LANKTVLSRVVVEVLAVVEEAVVVAEDILPKVAVGVVTAQAVIPLQPI
jgi:hypothetical protein